MSLLDRFRGRSLASSRHRKHEPFGPPQWTGRGGLVDPAPPISMRAGYRNNPVSYRALRMIAEACASIPLKVDRQQAPHGDFALEDALHHPNSYYCQNEFLERLYLDLLAFGNSYVEAVQTLERVEFYLLRPDHVSIVSDTDGWPIAYDHQHGGQVRRLKNHGDQPTLLHVKFHCPGDDHYGYGPLQAARGSIAMHNAAMEWNRGLFVNAARPSGALVYKGADGQGHLTEAITGSTLINIGDSFSSYRFATRMSGDEGTQVLGLCNPPLVYWQPTDLFIRTGNERVNENRITGGKIDIVLYMLTFQYPLG